MNAQAVVLGFDTSCYTTSVAAVDLAGNPVVSCRKLLPVAMGERGLRQSDALFIHVRQLPGLVEELAEQIRGREIVAVCASTKPREDENSYMPVFQAGDAQARGVAALLGVPCFASNHQRGHIEAALVGTGIPEGPLLAAHLSGGTTELVQYDGEHVTLIGGSHDLHAGQVVDRTGVALGLAFPAGPHLEELARRGASQARLPVSMEDGGLYCHLSGAETQIQRWIQREALPPEDIAREVYDLLARTVARMVVAAYAAYHLAFQRIAAARSHLIFPVFPHNGLCFLEQSLWHNGFMSVRTNDPVVAGDFNRVRTAYNVPAPFSEHCLANIAFVPQEFCD